MKYLYLRYLNLRLWLIRRRLRRRGFTAPSALPRGQAGHGPTNSTHHHRAERLDYIKIGIGSFGVASMWLIFFLRQSTPVDLSPDPFSNLPSTPNHLTHHHE